VGVASPALKHPIFMKMKPSVVVVVKIITLNQFNKTYIFYIEISCMSINSIFCIMIISKWNKGLIF
jgi:hypothetical protein